MKTFSSFFKTLTLSLILLATSVSAWAEGDFYNTYLTYTFGATSGSAQDQDNGTGLSKDLGTLNSGSFKITAVYLKCWDNWGSNYKSSGGQMCYSKDGGSTQYLTGFSRSNKAYESNNYEWQNTSANLTIANSTDKSGSYTLTCWFQTWGGNWGDRFFPKNSGNYTFTYKIAPPSVKSFTVSPSGDKLSGSGTQNDPYIIKYNGSLTLTLSGNQNHTDANSTIQYNTEGTWNTTNSRTISNITSTDVKNVTVKARYKNKTEALSGTESTQTIYYRSEQVYTVTFNANGHGTAPAAQTISKGSEATQPTAPTATGYTFGGWYKEAGCTNAFDFNTAINANITLYAKWTANTYTVTLDQQSGTGGTSSVTATYGSAMPSITIPTLTGYTFGGYFTGKNGAGTQYYKADGTSATTWNLEGAQTLYAKWTPITYSVKFNGNGSTSGSMSNQSFTYDEAAKALTTNAFKKTGYIFAGWNTAANGSGTSYADKATVRNLTTSNNATINLYAQWTIDKYTLTFGAVEGGSVTATVGGKEISSPTTLEYNTEVTLTATPSGKNAFAQWVDGNGNQISTKNPYELTITKNTTLKAEFTSPSKVYLKPFDFWKSDGVRIAAYYWGAAGNNWIELSPVDCEGHYYSVDIPAGYSNIIFARLKPSSATGYDKNNNGFNWENSWNQTANLTVQTNGKNLYDMHIKDSRIYLKPNSQWKTDGARFAAFFKVNADNNDGAKWMSMFQLESDNNYYWCDIPTDKNYIKVIFCRMKGTDANNNWENRWDESKQLDTQTNENNCFIINDGDWNNADGSWSCYQYNNKWTTFTTPTYPLTLKATPYGEYTVKCNGVSHTSSRTKDIVIDLPVGATVEITKAESYDAAYNNDLVIKTSSNSSYEAADLNTTYTFCGETTIEENFTTIADHTVFLRVPTGSVGTSWNTSGANYIWHRNRLGGVVATMTEADANDIKQESGYAYFKATVPAGHREFRFERKTGPNAGATNYTEYFEHLLPLGQSNCFTLDNHDGNMFYGNWGLSTANGDYRILYIEQQVAHGTDENDWQTVIDTTYQHASDIIKKGDGATIVSLHIKYDKTKHPEVILQKFTGGKWVDVEGQAHMVLGPLTASADMAMLPGRHNTEGDANLRYGDGIEEIKADAEENGKAGRVWNFTVEQTGDPSVPARLLFDPVNALNGSNLEPYSDDYYIRTDNAAGGWMTYTLPGNVMTYSEYSLEHSGYSHYFCKWVEIAAGTPNTKFVVANKYGAAISDTIVADDFTDGNGTLEADANVRWMWNEYTNIGSRAYIAGSKVSNFLVAKYAASSTKTFVDKGEWVYEADLTDVKIDDKLTSIAATYDAQVQELLEKSHADAGGLVMLASAGNARVSSYTVRIVYDFKINQTICYLIPTGNAVATSIDVLIERINQDEAGQATQVKAAITPANAEGLTVYGLITLTQDHITNPSKSEQEALTYWISFPFDVKIGDITGFGEVGKHWMIKYYDGAERAAKGWFLDTKTFWKFFLDTEDVMKANTGYVLTLNKSLLNESNPVYDNTETLRLYFPSMNKITTEINSGYRQDTVHITEHWCNITTPADRTTKDSHWNMIGVPSFANQTITTDNKTVKYFYDYSHKDDKYNTAKNAGAKTFKPMHAYMVQFAGVIDWNSQAFNEAQPQLAAKKNADAEEQYTLRLELQQNGTKADQTFVELHDDATTMFDMNVDLTKMFNTGANIYTLIGSDNQVAANVMPIANTVIPVGVQIAKAGEYTFAMPDGTDGITVELIDYETNTTTNLLLSEYNVSLPAGTFENRFALIVKPNKVATDMETIDDETNGVKKYIIDGKLFLQKDGMLYDAQGHIVR